MLTILHFIIILESLSMNPLFMCLKVYMYGMFRPLTPRFNQNVQDVDR